LSGSFRTLLLSFTIPWLRLMPQPLHVGSICARTVDAHLNSEELSFSLRVHNVLRGIRNRRAACHQSWIGDATAHRVIAVPATRSTNTQT